MLDANEAPTDITISKNSVDENSPAKTFIGDITVTDPDNKRNSTNPQVHSCKLLDDSNGIFVLTSYKLYVNKPALDFEQKRKHTIEIECTDSGVPSLNLKKFLTIDVNDVNEAPNGLRINNNAAPENRMYYYIGDLTGSDPDLTQQNLTYTLLTGNDYFKLLNNKLLTKIKLNYEKNQSFAIDIKVSDYKGLFCFVVCFFCF